MEQSMAQGMEQVRLEPATQHQVVQLPPAHHTPRTEMRPDTLILSEGLWLGTILLSKRVSQQERQPLGRWHAQKAVTRKHTAFSWPPRISCFGRGGSGTGGTKIDYISVDKRRDTCTSRQLVVVVQTFLIQSSSFFELDQLCALRSLMSEQ